MQRLRFKYIANVARKYGSIAGTRRRFAPYFFTFATGPKLDIPQTDRSIGF